MIGYAISFSVMFIFLFYISGTTITHFFKIRLRNPFISIAIGFFLYFSFITIFSFPLQIIGIVPYYFLIYYDAAITFVYLAFFLILFKFWISTIWISLMSIRYFLIVAIALSATWILLHLFSTNSFNDFRETLAIMNWISGNQLAFINDSTLFSYFGFKPFQAWYTLLQIIINLTNAQVYDYNDLIITFTLIIEAFLVASIILTIHTTFSKIGNKLFDTLVLFIMSIIFISIKTLFSVQEDAVWSERTLFMYLLIFIVIMLINYVTSDFRQRNMPILIGLMFTCYTSFSWDSSYPVLFLLFVFMFILQIAFKTSWTKDLIKISVGPIISVICFSVITNLIIQWIILVIIAFFMLMAVFIMNSRYARIQKVELFLSKHFKLSVLFVPTMFALLSLAMILGQPSAFAQLVGGYLTFIEKFLVFIKNEEIRYWIVILVSFALIILSIVWIILRDRLSYGIVVYAVDLFVISYLTFYNPIVIKFITVIYTPLLQSDGVMMLVMLIVVIVANMYYVINKINTKIKVSKSVNVNKLPVYIYVV
ncbi:hypothetical protein [Spiroplasma endosymbiont of Labia minor]|uniref:hypothetical protein n=1 Tax=Spiroplasma endosymbiont of Labia minor TaxID=3066305 RepID=UPI0030D4E3CB